MEQLVITMKAVKAIQIQSMLAKQRLQFKYHL
jgi:hypothetical protein